MLTVGTDSYVTLETANSYIEENYRSTNNLRVLWEALEDSDKEVLLKQSLREIDGLVLVGFKFYRWQKLAFPRNTFEIPEDIKTAQIENAIGILLEGTKQSGQNQSNIAKSLGLVKNIKDINPQMPEMPKSRKRLTSDKALEIMKGWVR